MQTNPIVEPGFGSFTFDELVKCSSTTPLEEKLLESLKSCAGYRKAERERCARMVESWARPTLLYNRR